MRLPVIFFLLFLLTIPEAGFAQQRKRNRTGRSAGPSSLNLHLDRSDVFNKGFSGFALYDPEAGEMVYEYNSDKYFTPASNTKILTFYTGLQILGDSIPALMYQKMDKLLIFWGTGDPSFLNPHLTRHEAVYHFLKNRPEKLVFCPANFKESRYGSGWMWSDFPYAYQAEKSPFPVYGNVAHFSRSQAGTGIEIRPSFLKNYIVFDSTLHLDDYVSREEFDNRFLYNKAVAQGDAFEWHVPFRATPEFVGEILSDTLKRHVSVIEDNLEPPSNASILYSVHADSLYRLMMQESDNFISEQLLLLCAGQKLGYMNTKDMIDYALDSLLADMPDELKWVDGSGLSRYNLFTPRSLVFVLNNLYKQVPRERLLGLFPAGGVSGTIENNYRNGAAPYVYAKTGTLRNNHCLSGYLVTSSGRLLIFSFMHNNYTIRISALKREMERVLRKIYASY